MGSVLGAILAFETVALVLLFPKFKQRLLQRKEARGRFLRSLKHPKPPTPQRRKIFDFLLLPSQPATPRKNRSSEIENQFPLLVNHQLSTANKSKANPEETLTAIKSYIGLDVRDEAGAIYTEAENGDRVAQFIVGMALRRSGRPGAKAWLRLSAEQDFEPAQNHLEETG